MAFAAVFAFCFTGCALSGMALDRLGTVWARYNNMVALFTYVVSFFAFFFLLRALPYLGKFFQSVGANRYLDNRFFQPTGQSFVYCFVFLALCHLPAFLTFFPGVFTYDVLFQAHFFIGKDFMEMHPLLHNLMIYGALLINQKLNSGILGVFIYTAFQVATVLSVFAYCIRVLSKYNTPFLLKLGALLFFAFYPTNQVFPLVATKDIFFAVFVLLFVLLVTELSIDKARFLNSKVKCCWFVIATLLVFLFRHNGFYAYILALPVFLYFYIKTFQLDYKKILLLFLLPVLLYEGFAVLKKAIGIRPPSLASSLSIPLQQLGRVRFLYDQTLSEDDKETYRKIIPPQNEMSYFPFSVDPLKFDNSILQHSDYIEDSLRNHPQYFKHLYFKWARLYPKEYVDAFLVTNSGFWNPFGKYNGLMHSYLYTDTRWHSIFGIPVYSYDMFPKLRAWYNWIFKKEKFNNHLVTRVLFSIGANTWYLIAACFILIYKRRYDLIMPLLLPLGLLVSVLFGPMVLLRYIYQNFLILPLLVVFCTCWDSSK